jgi:hypothetical protein
MKLILNENKIRNIIERQVRRAINEDKEKVDLAVEKLIGENKVINIGEVTAFHGTNINLNTFDITKRNDFGFHFAKDYDVALKIRKEGDIHFYLYECKLNDLVAIELVDISDWGSPDALNKFGIEVSDKYNFFDLISKAMVKRGINCIKYENAHEIGKESNVSYLVLDITKINIEKKWEVLMHKDKNIFVEMYPKNNGWKSV